MTAVSVLLVTANVGSIFEEPQLLLGSWVAQFLRAVQRLRPQLLALHCQEVGGKNYEESMQHVDQFVRSLVDSQELADFVHCRIFLDEDFTSTAKFTALGNLYFVHKSVASCQIWDFTENAFTDVSGQAIFSGNIESVPFKEKDKFPKDYFPDCKWSRKGFLRTRWKLSGVVFDLINIHLFHDASNFTAMQEYPSFYTKVRRDALTYTLDRIQNDEFENVPFFLFGDFNFRLNTGQVVKKIVKDILPTQVKHHKTESTERLLYRNSSDENPFLTVEKKVFDLINQEDVFYVGDNRQWLLEDDTELECFKDRLLEKEIKFPPSYPFTEDMCGTTYMKTRCPSWCDRILFSPSAKALIADEDSSPVEYQMLGANVPMGDHKPIFLSFFLKSGNACFPNDGIDEIEEHAVPESEPLRSRTNSSPSVYQPQSKSNARRVVSLLPGDTKSDSRSPQWLQATQAILRSLRLREGLTGSSEQPEPKQRVTRLSSRLTSHHSSSSEEWYSEMQLLSEVPDAPNDRLSADSASQPDLRTVVSEIEAEPTKELEVRSELEAGGESSGHSADLTERKEQKRRNRCCSRCNMT